MKIVYSVNNTWYSGGMTRVLTNKVNYLAKLGHHITIVSTDQNKNKPYYDIDSRVHHIDLGINYFFNDTKSFISRIFLFPKYYFLHYKNLKKVLHEIKPDVVVSMFNKDFYILPLVNDRSAKILEIHSSRETWVGNRSKRGLLGKIQNWIDTLLIKTYKKFIVLTQQDARNWTNLDNLVVIPNANTFQSQEVAVLNNDKAISVGRYDEHKNFTELIDVWVNVNKVFPGWKLEIYGDGDLRSNLQKKISDKGLSHVIILHKPTLKIQQKYLESSMFLFTSLHEGLPMVLLEAQECGLPMVSYDCPCGPGDIITDGENGYLIDVGDVDGMADRIIKLIENCELRRSMGERSKLNASNYSEDKIMKKWIDLFEELINKSVKI